MWKHTEHRCGPTSSGYEEAGECFSSGNLGLESGKAVDVG